MLKQRFSDFSEVVNKNSINDLMRKRPEMARLIDSATDEYVAGVALYECVKDLECKTHAPSRLRVPAKEDSAKHVQTFIKPIRSRASPCAGS